MKYDFNSWKKLGKFISVDGYNLFVVDRGKDKLGTVCILHGYPSCSFDYYKIIDELASQFRVIVHDHLGFGLSDKPLDYSYHLFDQAQIAIQLWQQLEINEMHLVAHDYGTSVATEILALKQLGNFNIKIKSLTLSNGSMLIDMAQLRFIQRVLKTPVIGRVVAELSLEFVFMRNMTNIWYDKSKVDRKELHSLWTFLVCNNGRKVLAKITRYIDQRYEHYDRWIGALQKTNIPTLVLWADNDPVAIKEMGPKLKSLIPNSSLVKIPLCGHYPMLERDKIWLSALKTFLDS